MQHHRLQQFVFATLLTGFLAACGGGGSLSTGNNGSGNGGNTPPPVYTPPPDTVPTELTLITPDSVTQGQAVGLVALLPESLKGYEYKWRQLSGPTVKLLADTSQVVGFDAQSAGDYVFEFSVQMPGQSLSDTVNISVQASSTPTAQVRLDHQAVEQGKVSFRADSYLNDIASVNWQQLRGPAVTLDTQQQMLFFDAPKTDHDTLFEFKATITLNNGQQVSDSAFVLVNHAEINETGLFPFYAEQVVSTTVHPFYPDSPYADKLSSCVYSNLQSDGCTLDELPLIGQVTHNPTIDDIMNRVLVSHQWMGERFKAFLQQSDTASDIIRLLRATTAIVISYDVRPSFYWVETGAIYLDADNFWRTPAERDTLNDAPDYRAAFGSELQFQLPWTYLKNGGAAFTRYDANDRLTRSFNDSEVDAAYLLYHELSHANDRLGYDVWDTLDGSLRPVQVSQLQQSVATRMTDLYPLQSSVMKALAGVSYRGESATTQQKAMRPADITAEFKQDYATDYYNYVTQEEDLAMFFQHMMVSYRLGLEPIIAVTDTSNNNIVDWGQFSRVASPDLQDKTRFVASHIIPELNTELLLSSLYPTGNMRAGVSFSDSALSGRQAKAAVIPYRDLMRDWQHVESRIKHKPMPHIKR
ncbi:PKD domain-containing protein [Neptunicella marina]|uniref:Uncharacterized protein n=1 Tax=Neptunicella marina TaxID=2125989 RepID=A0A8J6M3R3_9ALTE|nr:hypothetical protein [Neptunicella marina]MBC3767347.1 hypothetical protein [Neptunicella marina]